jgi:hypothetical protein
LPPATAHGAGIPVYLADLVYMAEYTVGTPPQRVQSVVDTASDLIVGIFPQINHIKLNEHT